LRLTLYFSVPAKRAGKTMQIDGYEIDILVQGYPGKTVCHGGLGWSTGSGFGTC
jgi:hypothetical protein